MRPHPHLPALREAHAAGDYVEGLRLARAAGEPYWQARMLALLGRAEESVEALRQGLADGVWFNPPMMDRDIDLDSIRALPAFQELRAECIRRHRKAQERSHPQCLVTGPASTGWEPRTLVVLHRWGDTAAGFAGAWMPLVDRAWTIVAPQSSQVCDSASFCWDDAEKARSEILQHLDDCRRKRGLPPEGMVIAGASQGARLAMEIACETGLPWLSVIPSFPAAYDVSRFTAVPGHTRGAFILGADDPVNARTRPVISGLESGGVHVHLTVMEGVGHDLPGDFAARAERALNAVLEDAQAVSG